MNDKEIYESGKIVLDYLRNKEYVDVRFTGQIISVINCRNGGVSDVKVSPTLVFRGDNNIKQL